jgi:hypothetical protein
VAASRFVGTWVGTQAWAIDTPPPGARQDQPVTLSIELVGGTLVGTMTPFMGGQDGATFLEAKIVGEELHVSAMVGKPRTARGDEVPGGPPVVRGRTPRGLPPRSWKDPVQVTFIFKNDGVSLTGTADVRMNDVPWLRFKYDLSKKRSRY